MNYHVFFTTQYTDPCIQNCRFGATSVNSLANVKKGDIAFLFDGLRWKVYGPLNINSSAQYHDASPIYGKNQRDVVNYTNRVSFDLSNAQEMLLNKLFVQEADFTRETYLLNRTILSVIIANKQVHSTPLTSREGEYLKKMLLDYGDAINQTTQDSVEGQSIVDYVVAHRKPKSEAIFELLLLENRHNRIIEDLDKSKNKIFNQFVLGLQRQRQIDILSIGEENIAIIELKKKENEGDPYEQLREYRDYALSDYRVKDSWSKKIKLIAILEEGNKYLNKSIATNYSDISVFEFTMMKDYMLQINKYA